MKLETAEAIRDAANQLGYQVRVHESYSGRGMFGKTTVALSGDKSELLRATVYAGYRFGLNKFGDQMDEFMDDLDWRWDNLGHDDLAY